MLRAQHQGLDSRDLMYVHAMLRQAYLVVKNNYYDPAFHGVNFDESYRRHDALLNSSESVNAGLRVIADFLGELQDSHTFFMPPLRTKWSTLDFSMAIIGEKCFVTRIRPGSDAEKKLHAGERILALDGLPIKRTYFNYVQYLVGMLSPMRYETVVVQSQDGRLRTVTIMNTLHKRKALLDTSRDGSDIWDLIRENEDTDERDRGRTFEIGDMLVWKMPSFIVDPDTVDSVFAKARKHKVLVLDLRGNAGGRSDVLKDMLANLFDHQVIMGTRVTKKGARVEIIKPKRNPFTDGLIVLIDSGSASAAEIFARVVQLEHRGRVIGDRSAGAVMEARLYDESVGADLKVFYKVSVTSANLLMSDGTSLEKVGVTPDELILPTQQDLASGRDPVLSRAAQLAGVELDPEAAGQLFPLN